MKTIRDHKIVRSYSKRCIPFVYSSYQNLQFGMLTHILNLHHVIQICY